MFILVIILVIVGALFLKWLKPFLEYKKIGNYAEYKCISKTFNDYDDKDIEYSWYQINGFKNINQEAMEYLHQVSRCCTQKNLKWLNECREFLEEGLVRAGENDASKLFLPDPIEKAGLFDILKVIKRSRKYLPEHYQSMGCSTCGEAVVMHLWIELRIQQIEGGEAIKPGDLDYVIDAVKEIQNHSV